MLIEYRYPQNYLFTALSGAPALFDQLLQELTEAEADRRPDPERFTIREVIAHLAEWDAIFLERMQRICNEDTPLLPDCDEGQMAIEHDYAHKDVAEQLQLFRARRAAVIAFLKERKPEEWSRVGNRPEIGMLTLEGIAFLMAVHDTYHVQQVVDYRAK